MIEFAEHTTLVATHHKTRFFFLMVNAFQAYDNSRECLNKSGIRLRGTRFLTIEILIKGRVEMISTERIVIIAVSGIIILAIFLLLLYYSKHRKLVPIRKKTNEQEESNENFEICFKIWQQERGLVTQRLILLLTTNSILLLAYVQVRVSMFGGIIAIFSIVGNILFFAYLFDSAKTLDTLQRRLEPKLPIEIKKRIFKGRWGFVLMIITFESVWVISALYSFLGWFL